MPTQIQLDQIQNIGGKKLLGNYLVGSGLLDEITLDASFKLGNLGLLSVNADIGSPLDDAYFRNGGNPFIAASSLGNTTNFDLKFITNSIERLRVNDLNFTSQIPIIAPANAYGSGSFLPLARNTATGIFETISAANLINFLSLNSLYHKQSGNAFGTEPIIGSTDAYDVRFIASNAERFRVGIASITSQNPFIAPANSYSSGSFLPLVRNVTSGAFEKATASDFLTFLSLPTGYHKQGGNAYGATSVVGTTDSQGLNLITANTPRLSFTASTGIGTFSKDIILNGHHMGLGGGQMATNINFGYQAGQVQSSLSNQNIFIGYQSGLANINSSKNVGIGTLALSAMNQATALSSQNTAVGHASANATTTGTNITSLGASSLNANTIGSNLTVLGVSSGFTGNNMSNSTYVGYNVWNGPTSLNSANFEGHYNTFIGGDINTGSGSSKTNFSVAIGWDIFKATGIPAPITECIAIGYRTMRSAYGAYNVAVGNGAGGNLGTGTRNVLLGHISLNQTVNIDDTVAIGHRALYQRPSSGGNRNVVIGSLAGDTSAGTAGLAAAFGATNLFIGYKSGYNNGGSGNVFLGNETGSAVGSNAVSNQLYIDNSSTTTPLIHGDFSARTVTFNGNVFNNAPAYTTGGFALLVENTTTRRYENPTIADVKTYLNYLLSQLGDTNIVSPANNQLLKYDLTTSKWINFTPSFLTNETDPVWTAASVNYYTISQLSTGGSGANVAWGNITGAPSFTNFWTLTGSALYPTSAGVMDLKQNAIEFTITKLIPGASNYVVSPGDEAMILIQHSSSLNVELPTAADYIGRILEFRVLGDGSTLNFVTNDGSDADSVVLEVDSSGNNVYINTLDFNTSNPQWIKVQSMDTTPGSGIFYWYVISHGRR